MFSCSDTQKKVRIIKEAIHKYFRSFVIAILIVILFHNLQMITHNVDVASKTLTDLQQSVGYTQAILMDFRDYVVYPQVYDSLALQFVLYQVQVDGMPLEWVRLGRSFDGGYVVPLNILRKTDVMLGYGIADDISFEQQFSQRFKRPSYGFDCGVPSIVTGDENCHFYSECIGNNKSVYPSQQSSGSIASFEDHYNRFHLKGKLLFIKMDIEGAEYDVMEEILHFENSIVGITMELHFNNHTQVLAGLSLTSLMNKYFYLVHIHGNNYESKREITSKKSIGLPRFLELTYVNKRIVSEARVAKNQTHPSKIDQPNNRDQQDSAFQILIDTQSS